MKWVVVLWSISLCFAFSVVDERDGLQNLGRVPLISEWEILHPTEPFGKLSLELQALLNKTEEFQQKGKLDLVEKMYHRIIEDSDSHPDVLQSYGDHIERIMDEPLSAFHYYVYSLHQCCGNLSPIKHYFRLLPIVQDYDRQLFTLLDNQESLLEEIDITRSDALEIIQTVQKHKRIEHVYHTNAIEGNSLSHEVTRAIIETGKIPDDGIYHPQEIYEIWGTLEAFDYSSYVALESYQSLLDIASGADFVTLEIDTHKSLLTIPSLIRDQNEHEDMLESMTGTQEHLNFIFQIHKMILGSVMPDAAGERDVSVGGYVPPNWTEIPILMEKFGEWLCATEHSDILHTIERAALAHYQLVWIHPFQDGNGRTARMLMNTIMMGNGYPPIMIKLEDRERYYEALRSVQHSGDTRPFIYFIYQMAFRSVEEYIEELKHLFTEDLGETGILDLS